MQSLERATVFEGAQVGVETVPGTAVSANKRLLCTSIEAIKPEIPTTPWRTYGSKAASSVIAGKGMGSASLRAAMCPNDLAYLFASGLCNPVISTPGGGMDTRNWLFKPLNFGPDAITTLTIEKGSFAGGDRTTYGVLNGFDIDININDPVAQMTGNMLARTPDISDVWPTGYEVYEIEKSGTITGGTFKLHFGTDTADIDYDATAAEAQAALEALASLAPGDVVCYGGPINSTPMQIVIGGASFGTNPTDMTIDDTNITGGGDYVLSVLQQGATVTDLPAIPIPSSEFDIYVATAYASLPAAWTTGTDASQLLRCSRFQYSMPDRWIPGNYLDTTQDSYSCLIEKEIEGASATVSHMANAEGRAFLPYLTAGTRLFVRALGLGSLIEGSLYNGIQITGAFEVMDYAPADNNGAYDAEIKLQNVYDSDLGGFLEIQLRNELTAL